jgi:hypothetical protein
MRTNNQRSVTICGQSLPVPQHVCAFFDSHDEQYEILLPWIKEGIANNEEVLNILAGKSHADHCRRLEQAGIPVADAKEKSQLKFVASEDTYLQGGSFAAERMLNIVEQAVMSAASGPYGMLRACGDMEWAVKNLPVTDELIEYEARLNQVTERHHCSIVCCYDVNKFSGSAIADVLATHPYVIMNGKIHQNPHYIEPVEFLGKLIKRSKRPLASTIES